MELTEKIAMAKDIDWHQLLQMGLAWLVTSGLRIVLIVLLTMVALTIAKAVSRKIFSAFKQEHIEQEMQKRADTLGALVNNILRFVIVAVSSIMILEEFGIDIGPILAAAGIVGLAIGFGAQRLVQDIIGGFFILVEDQIRVGDVVNVSGKGGQVERVTLRMTILRDLNGHVHYISNGHIDVVTNMTKGFSYYVFDVGIGYREDVDEVIEVLKEIDVDLQQDSDFRGDILEPLEVLGLDKFAESAVIIKARLKTKPIKQWRVGREFNRRMKMKFDEKKIEIPFPHVTVYMGEVKNGEAAPLKVKNMS